MQSIFITGNLGKDSELRQTQAGEDVLSFSVASKQGWGDKATTNWFRCSIWGKRARTLKDHLVKGVKVAVQGGLEVGEYQGKAQLDVRVNEVEFMSSGERKAAPADTRGTARDDLDDDVPF